MGSCSSSNSQDLYQIMIAGIENCGKTYFLYSKIKNFTIDKPYIKTLPTDCIKILSIYY